MFSVHALSARVQTAEFSSCAYTFRGTLFTVHVLYSSTVLVQERPHLQRGAGAAAVGPRAAPLGREHADRRLRGRRDAPLPDATQVLHAA